MGDTLGFGDGGLDQRPRLHRQVLPACRHAYDMDSLQQIRSGGYQPGVSVKFFVS